MKKFWVILLVLVVLILVALVVIVLIPANDNFIQKSYISNDEKINAIIVDVADREVEVRQSTDGQIHIDYYESEKEYYNLSVNDNNELSFTIAYNKSWLDYFRLKPNITYRKIYLQVPANLLDSIKISTTNETIKLENISVVDTVTLNSNGGDVDVNNLNVGKQIDLVAKNGDIKGSIVGYLDDFCISCNIKKGNCNLPTHKEGGAKSLFADCNNGNIVIDFVQ